MIVHRSVYGGMNRLRFLMYILIFAETDAKICTFNNKFQEKLYVILSTVIKYFSDKKIQFMLTVKVYRVQ